MQLTAYLTAVRSRLRVPVADAMFPPEVLTDYVNQALDELATEREWPWLFKTDATNTATAVDTATYSLPTGYVRTRSLSIGAMDVREIDDAEADQFLGSFEDAPTAKCFTVDLASSVLTIYPTPGSVEAMVHRYIRGETVLVGDDDEPVLPDRFAGAVVAKACQLAAEGVSDPRAGRFEAAYDRWVQKMLDDLRRVSGPKRVHLRPGGWF